MKSPTIRLTTAQALVRWMTAQRSELLDGTEVPLFAGVFAIFGHGNVLGLGTALHAVRGVLPTWRAQTEQGMALAAVAYARAMDRRQVMVGTSSVGPGALNMVTAAGVAHANRLPLLLLPGDTFTGRAPDPVLQQLEHYGDPTITANDAFRPVSRYFDRITKPEQLLASLPQVIRVLTDPADTGPVVMAMPQDVQVEEFDFPVGMFEPRLVRVPRPRPDTSAVASAVEVIRSSRRPVLVVGGGVRYSGAHREVVTFAEAHRLPVVDTVAGRTLVPHAHELYAGPWGIVGSSSANAIVRDADVVIAIGTRLQDFMTSSWTGLAPDVRLIQVNAARFDAVKHSALSVVGDARVAIQELGTGLAGWTAEFEWRARAQRSRVEWDAGVDALRAVSEGSLTYAQVLGVVNDASGADDYVMGASGGFPGEMHGGWRSATPRTGAGSAATMDLEYGFSCMGYEIAGAWGAALARGMTHPGGIVTTLLGDGSYLMLNSELFSAAFAGHPFIAVVCDNGGFAVIHRLQTSQGAEGFNNLWIDCSGAGAVDVGPRVDFAMHARSLGCWVEDVPAGSNVDDFRSAYLQARAQVKESGRPVVVVCRTHPSRWTDSGAWWEVGVPSSLRGREIYAQGKGRQLRWVSGP